MPPKAKTTPKPADPTTEETPAEQPAEETPAEEPADFSDLTPDDMFDLFRAAVAEALAYHVGHTNNNKIKLAQGNWSDWAPTMAEYIGVRLEDIDLYTGPEREQTEPGKWEDVDLRDKHGKTHAEARAWYAPMPRLTAGARHLDGCKAMGWKVDDKLAMWQPGRNDLYEISASSDPIATAHRLATSPRVSIAASLNKEKRKKLDRIIGELVTRARDNKPWWGGLSDLTHDYTPEQLIESVARVTEDDDDSAGLIEAMGNVLAPEAKPATTAEATD